MQYSTIKTPPQEYSSGNIISRFIDGLAFRYFWATEGLTDTDLAYTPSDSAMSTLDTLIHMVWLSEMIRNTLDGKVSDRAINQEIKGRSFNELRSWFLENLENASIQARLKTLEELGSLQIVIKSGEKEYPYPLWNMMSGPLADALYHTGQLVSFRRSSGNPLPKGINHLAGTAPSY
jgi:uncharacterized damage-inducible protein DinB